MGKIAEMLYRYPRWTMLVAGGVSATGFAPLNFWPLTVLCVALLMHFVAIALTGKRAFLYGWLFGLGHFTISNNWIAKAFTFQSNMPEWLGWCAVPLIALYLALYPALAAWGGWMIANRSDAKRTGITMAFILAFAGCWIISEWLRSWVFTGFAWNPLGIIAVGEAAAPAIFIGSYGLSGIIFTAIGVLLLLANRKWRDAAFIGLPLAVFAMVSFFVFADSSITAAINGKAFGRHPVDLTIVQPNISQIDKYAPGYEAINFARLAQHSAPRNSRPRLLLWPEAAIPWRLEEGYPFRFYQFQPGESPQGARLALMRLMNPGDVLVTGGDRLEFDDDGQLIGARNSANVMDSSGKLLGVYDKAHLVPFGEYLALRWLLEPLGATRLVPGDLDFWPGPGPRTSRLPFNGKHVKVGMQICYEIIFSGQVIDRTNRPDFIFNPSNDAWFGSWGPPQFVAQAQLRAIEEGLPVVRATPTGISAVINADGRIVHSLPHGKAGRIDAALPLAKVPTLFAQYGNILPLAFAALLIMLSLLPLARRRTLR